MLSLALFLVAVMAAQPGSRERAQEATLDGILGVSVGMTAGEARSRLALLGSGDSRRTRDGGLKEVWRLDGSGFAWIAFKADADGRLVWVTGHRRPGHDMAFDRLASRVPDTRTDSIAIWHVEGAGGQHVRVTARGRHQRAQVLTLMLDE